jgi:hypothetical protein
MTTVVKMADGKVRLTNEELHRRVGKAIFESDHIVFDSLPGLIAQIIENRVWETYKHDNFAGYALDATSNGLGINSNQRLWLLRCAMDVHGKHIAEWADVLAKVEEMVKSTLKEDGGTVRALNGNSLEMLAKDGVSPDTRITYLPSRQTSGSDGALLRLRKNYPKTFKQVLAGKMTPRQGMVAARQADGIKTGNQSNLSRAQSAFRMMSKTERSEFIAWLSEEGHL